MNPIASPSRREVLGATAAVALGALAVGGRAFAEEKAKRPYKKAIMFGMLEMKGASLTEKFKALKAAGFDGVELNAPGQHTADEVHEACKQSGIEIEGVVDAFHW